MDRALSLNLLTGALGTHARLPSASELQTLLSQVEVSLFTRQTTFDRTLLDAGWYLQSVATLRADLQVHSLERQRQAHQVSGHIFDLALQAVPLNALEKLQYTFGAQIAYLGGGLAPNAAAVARRIAIDVEPADVVDPGTMSLEAGILLLALDRPGLYPLLGTRISQLTDIAERYGTAARSPYAVADAVVRGVRALTEFLTYGRIDALERARTLLQSAVVADGAPEDIESRWVAAHLLRLNDGLQRASVWTTLPPDLTSAARAMTLGDPPVLQLWPPQLSFLSGDDSHESPLSPSVRRLVLSFPTSAGKSLLAQLLVTAHLVNGKGGVCVVAPTHSLCRELSSALQRRLRTLGYQLYQESPLGFEAPKPAAARAVVMTPEKLAARLRSDPLGLLAEFGMFVIDEAHLVADRERGWRLEGTISLLHDLTRETYHRILLLSAALGSQAHVLSWLDPGGGVVAKHENWRGPRRLSVVFTTRPDWPSAIDEPAAGSRRPRQVVPLKGVVHLRTGLETSFVRGEFSEPVGELVRRQQMSGNWVRDAVRSTTQRAQLIPLIHHIRASGSVLIVEATKSEAQRLAEELADSMEDDPSMFALVDLVRSRLGQEHPLARVLPRGVAFHHAALPVDIQSEIEDAVRAGRINCLVSTSTLTEGVNLPFKSVVIARRGYRDADGFVEVIDGARLLNAVGRAGRAGRETEGWLILAEQQPFSRELFEPLDRTEIDLDMRSTLATEDALEQLAILETAARQNEDSLFQTTAGPAADAFVSYVWLVAQALTEVGNGLSEDSVLSAVQATLAWQQLDEPGRVQLLQVAARAYRAYVARPSEQRRRWAQSGMSLPSAASLEAIADEVLASATEEVATYPLPDAIGAILGEGRLDAILNLEENRRSGFKPRRNARRDEALPVDVTRLLADWVSGVELQTLADTHLGAVDNEDYRYEQLSEFIASVFEHYLPWSLGVVIAWVNEALDRQGVAHRIPDDLAAVVHFGVATRDALTLMLGGVRSRRLANRVGERRAQSVTSPDVVVRDWLAAQDISAWRDDFDASPTEIADLLAFARDPGVQLVNEVLEGGEYSLPYTQRAAVLLDSPARLRREDGQPEPAPFAIMVSGELVGTIGPEHHDDIAMLTGIGIPLEMSVRATDPPSLVLRLATEPADQ